MAIKDILLRLETGDVARPAHDFALSLAEQTGAHLTAAGVVIEAPPAASALGSFAPDLDFGATEILAKVVERRREAVEKAYVNFAKAAPSGVQTELLVIQAFEQKARDDFARLARHFDLSIIAPGCAEGDDDGKMLLSSALFASGRPVFVIPAAHKVPARLERVLVCWDGGQQAARALAEALPLLAQAKSVEVVCVAEAENAKKLPGFNITRHLARHGIAAGLLELETDRDAGSAILACAAERAADFLVMGGYGHWRLSEMILGGATRTILAETPIPVLMAH